MTSSAYSQAKKAYTDYLQGSEDKSSPTRRGFKLRSLSQDAQAAWDAAPNKPEARDCVDCYLCKFRTPRF